jgi:thiosulfate/3-mercaptopyruvate sulfurtransferase
MHYTTLLSPSELSPHLADSAWLVVDCRFSLANPGLGRQSYLQAHIPRAVYAHLDDDLSGPKIPGVTGRHPLPSSEAAAQMFSRLGINPGMQVVAYDDMGGALAAARLWWMLRWLGHNTVAILDGGWQRWQAEGYPTQGGNETREPGEFIPRERPEQVTTAQDILAIRHDPNHCLLDARSAERYRGENETIDPVAGHIPGAVSAPFSENLTAAGIFRPAEQLRAHYQALLDNVPAQNAVCYCGSGVSAAHDILAIVHAGLGEARLYAGSWSEWITDPARFEV